MKSRDVIRHGLWNNRAGLIIGPIRNNWRNNWNNGIYRLSSFLLGVYFCQFCLYKLL
jgi:hypothetical protein